MKRETLFSPDRKYRYTLWRDWSEQMKNGVFFTEDPHTDFYPGKRNTFVQFIGLNPSTADETKDDPTIRRCIGFAKAWGFGALCMTNLFAFRATDPAKMMKAPNPLPTDFRNVHCIEEIAKEASLVVCAWGNHGSFHNQSRFVREVLRRAKITVHHLGLTSQFEPKHPLYLPKDSQLIKWE